MSDDDWEKEVDEIVDNKKDVQTIKKFEDEDAHDSDEEKKKAEAAKKVAVQEPGRVKNKAKDYDQMFEERQTKKKGPAKPTQVQEIGGKKSQAAKGEELAKVAEEDITEQLFATDIAVESKGLKAQANYESFAKKVGEVLYEGEAPYNIPYFFAELAKGLSKSQTKTEEVKLILDKISVIYNARIAEDKKRDGNVKKPANKQKPAIKMGKAIDNTKNNNAAIIDDLVGSDEDEYGDYDDEIVPGKTGSKREAEGDYDFM